MEVGVLIQAPGFLRFDPYQVMAVPQLVKCIPDCLGIGDLTIVDMKHELSH
jgi:hypothetical protein